MGLLEMSRNRRNRLPIPPPGAVRPPIRAPLDAVNPFQPSGVWDRLRAEDSSDLPRPGRPRSSDVGAVGQSTSIAPRPPKEPPAPSAAARSGRAAREWRVDRCPTQDSRGEFPDGFPLSKPGDRAARCPDDSERRFAEYSWVPWKIVSTMSWTRKERTPASSLHARRPSPTPIFGKTELEFAIPIHPFRCLRFGSTSSIRLAIVDDAAVA